MRENTTLRVVTFAEGSGVLHTVLGELTYFSRQEEP
jgi:hypothetical protein